METLRFVAMVAAIALAVQSLTPTAAAGPTSDQTSAEMPGEETDMPQTQTEQPVAVTLHRDGDRVWLDGVERHPFWITHMGSLYDSAVAQVADLSPAWLYGGTGHAFVINMHEVICPSGPTAWMTGRVDQLAANVGLPTQRIMAHNSQPDFAAVRAKAFEAVKASIDAGRPCVLWEAAIPEWYTVVGYDRMHILFLGLDDQVHAVHVMKLAQGEIGWLNVLLPTTGEAASDRQVVREALQYALNHAAGRFAFDNYKAGLAGYDLWIAALGNVPQMENVKDTAFGQRYNAACWAECRTMAAGFLKEAKQRLDDPALVPHFDAAIKNYGDVAAALKRVTELTPFFLPEGEDVTARIMDEQVREQVIAALTQARDAEERGLADLKQLLAAMNRVEQRQSAAP